MDHNLWYIISTMVNVMVRLYDQLLWDQLAVKLQNLNCPIDVLVFCCILILKIQQPPL